MATPLASLAAIGRLPTRWHGTKSRELIGTQQACDGTSHVIGRDGVLRKSGNCYGRA